ncbi:MAG: hypothetical protein GY850_19110 [bacterium]|nr:hypothetical protein [bacterium]
MTEKQLSKLKSESIFGAFFAGSAFLIWGLGVVYWKALTEVPPLEIIVQVRIKYVNVSERFTIQVRWNLDL